MLYLAEYFIRGVLKRVLNSGDAAFYGRNGILQIAFDMHYQLIAGVGLIYHGILKRGLLRVHSGFIRGGRTRRKIHHDFRKNRPGKPGLSVRYSAEPFLEIAQYGV